MKILGISAFYHDSAAALVVDGKIISAAQEERFTRKRHDSNYPRNAIRHCLSIAKLDLSDIDAIVFYEKPFIKFERLLETYLAVAPRGIDSFTKSMSTWLHDKLFQKKFIAEQLTEEEPSIDWNSRLLFSEHHLSHAASAFYPSPYREALVLTLDGVGEWTTASVALGKDSNLEIQKEIVFPHSLGLLYSAFTYYTGFKVNSGEYKVMGLAPYGVPRYKDLILSHLIDLKDDGSFRLNLDYFDYCAGLRMTNERFHRLFGAKPRRPTERLTQREMDLAASVQAVTEEVMLRLTRHLANETGQKNLCLAGGVALNCVANGKVLRSKAFENIWIQPAAGDAGGALGAALAIAHLHFKEPRTAARGDSMKGSYLGNEYSQAEIEAQLRAAGAKFTTLSDDALFEKCADALASEKALGWFQGRMEFGPRALGARSILGDARSPKMQSTLNLKVKFRESFRPFAPAVLKEDVSQWFELDCESPYMLLVADVLKSRRREMTESEQKLFGIEKLNVVRSEIPAVTHVDYSARVQTVDAETHPRYHALISAFKRKTGCPVVVNTSFNVRGEPIVESPTDAFRCFMGTDIDALAVGNCYLEKADQDPALKLDYKEKFELD